MPSVQLSYAMYPDPITLNELPIPQSSEMAINISEESLTNDYPNTLQFWCHSFNNFGNMTINSISGNVALADFGTPTAGSLRESNIVIFLSPTDFESDSSGVCKDPEGYPVTFNSFNYTTSVTSVILKLTNDNSINFPFVSTTKTGIFIPNGYYITIQVNTLAVNSTQGKMDTEEQLSLHMTNNYNKYIVEYNSTYPLQTLPTFPQILIPRLHYVWINRPDLQSVYPEVIRNDYRNLESWAENYGAGELPTLLPTTSDYFATH